MVVLSVVVPVPANRSEKQLALHDGQLSFAGFLLFISQCFLPGLPAIQTPISLLALRSRQPLPRGEPILARTPPESAKNHRTVALTPYRRCSYSVPVLLKLLAELARGSGSRGCGSALATRAGSLRKTANVIHPPLTSSSNASRTEKRSGRGAVRSGA
jgi:hypothetical protein